MSLTSFDHISALVATPIGIITNPRLGFGSGLVQYNGHLFREDWTNRLRLLLLRHPRSHSCFRDSDHEYIHADTFQVLLIADLLISALDQSLGATASTLVLGCRRRCLRVTSWQPSKRLNELIIKYRIPSTFDIYEGTWASSSCPSFCPRPFHVFAINSQIMNPHMCSL